MSTNPVINAPSQAELEQLFADQKVYAPSLVATNASVRSKKLKSIQDYLINHEAEVIKVLKEDFSKPEVETLLSELGIVLSQIRHIRSNLKSWMKPKAVKTPLSATGTQSYVHYEPKGQVLIIAPWNYPLNLALVPTVYAIAAGCTVTLKPSEFTPATTGFLKKMINELFPAREVSVIEGEGATAAALTAMPFNHIFFTGSPQVGKLVMKAASANLTSVTLELGGKSPTVVDQTANLKTSVERMVWGKHFNAGQTCIAPDYVLVPQAKEEDFIEAYKNQVSKRYGKDPELSEDYARIISDKHFARIKELLDDAVTKGAIVKVGGQTNATTRYIAPTLLTGVTSDMKIMQEEIFGPLMPVMTYRQLEEVPVIINSRPKALTMYINSKQQKNINYLIDHTSSGGVVINDYLLGYANPNLPFGGVNNSGIGKSLGHHGFLDFTNERGVIHRRFLDLAMVYPPYTDKVRKLVKMIYRWL